MSQRVSQRAQASQSECVEEPKRVGSRKEDDGTPVASKRACGDWMGEVQEESVWQSQEERESTALEVFLFPTKAEKRRRRRRRRRGKDAGRALVNTYMRGGKCRQGKGAGGDGRVMGT